MVKMIMNNDNSRGGLGWRFQCWKCNYKVGIDKPFPETCPGCQAPGWWGHLVCPNNSKKDGDHVKTLGNFGKVAENTEIDTNLSSDKTPGGIMVHKRILSQLPDDVGRCPLDSEGIYKPSHGQGKGRPRLTVPEDLIMELAGQGFSSRAMVEELAKHGVAGIGYKTIQRRLQESLL